MCSICKDNKNKDDKNNKNNDIIIDEITKTIDLNDKNLNMEIKRKRRDSYNNMKLFEQYSQSEV